MISDWLLFFISIMLLCSTLMVVQTHITTVIKLLIVQNVLLVGYLLIKSIQAPNSTAWISFVITSVVKVIVLPWLLLKLKYFLNLSGRIEPILNKPTLLILAAVLVLFALMLGRDMITVLPQPSIAGFSLALANAFIALLLIIVRRKTVTQIIALLVLENSIFILAAALSTDFPWLIELGMSFDVLLGVMIFALFLMRIQREYGSFQVHHIEKLKERL
jgi:hydrogenase-4 component E